MKFILASASPRRRELLQMLGLSPLEIRPARGEEKPHPELGPAELVMELSAAKAGEIAAAAGAEDVVIAADTVVALDGRVLGKPRDAAQAGEMLRALSGREHSVYTGVTLRRGETELRRAEHSLVRFRPLEGAEVARYIATGEPLDKAGAYGAQGRGSLFVERIEGDFFNVMGLPLCLLGKMMKEFGIDLI